MCKTARKIMARTRVYLDWAATAPMHPQAAAAVAEACARLAAGDWANPSSVHAPGRAARRALEEARARIAARLGVPTGSILFTSGGTEAIALGLAGAPPGPRLVGATEHPAVRAAAPGARPVPVDSAGRIDPDALAALLAAAGGPALVAIQHANNETGVIQDAATIAEVVHAAGGLWLADCVQTAGKLPLPEGADMIVVSAHKLGGPPGVGALILRARARFSPPQPGGGQEGGLRGGTENLPGILGFAAALEALEEGWAERLRPLQRRLEDAVRAAGGEVNAANAPRLATVSSIRLAGLAAATQLMALDLAGVAVSQGSACSSGTLRPSETLLAMGLAEAASESLRVSTGWGTGEADIARFLEAWQPLAARARRAGRRAA